MSEKSSYRESEERAKRRTENAKEIKETIFKSGFWPTGIFFGVVIWLNFFSLSEVSFNTDYVLSTLFVAGVGFWASWILFGIIGGLIDNATQKKNREDLFGPDEE